MKQEWMSSPLKGKRLKKRTRERCGLQAAIQRRVKPEKPAPVE